MLPAVARRSPARTTPPSHTIAMMVVPCGRSRATSLGAPRTGEPGSSPGACDERKSLKDEDCNAIRGTSPGSISIPEPYAESGLAGDTWAVVESGQRGLHDRERFRA